MDDTTTKERRDGLIAKVRALLAKTVANGATEAEAMAAAAKAGQLMDAHDIAMTEVEAEQTELVTAKVASKRGDPLGYVADGIGEFCQCQSWVRSKPSWDDEKDRIKRSYTVEFFGFPADVEVAEYLAGICARVLENARTERRRDYPGERRKHTNDYVLGVAVGMTQTLREMARERRERARPAAGGTALVVVKDALIRDELQRQGIRIKSGGDRWVGKGFGAGVKDGRAVRFDPAVTGRAGAGRLA